MYSALRSLKQCAAVTLCHRNLLFLLYGDYNVNVWRNDMTGSATHAEEALFFLFTLSEEFLWSRRQLYRSLYLKDSSWMKCWNVGTRGLRLAGIAGNFCSLEVMLVKDGAGPIFFCMFVSFFFLNLSDLLVFWSMLISVSVCVCVRGSELSLIPPNLPFTHILPPTLLSSVSRSGLVPAVPQQQWEPRGCLSAEMVGLLCSARLDSRSGAFLIAALSERDSSRSPTRVYYTSRLRLSQ